mgnify:CR=1 FL=1
MTKLKHSISALFILSLFGLLLSIGSCKHDHDIPCNGSMFGRPITATGLDDGKCNPNCECKNFTAKEFTPQQLDALKTWVLSSPFEELLNNPYNEALPEQNPAVCAVIIENLANRLYRLQTYSNEAAAKAAGAILTHHDACGLCSTLSDLAVYAEDLDIGTPVRQCAIANFTKPFDSLVNCIQGLGFTKPCAQIWAYNARNTQAQCLQECLNPNLTTYHNADGSLNECLECDEIKSGPVFKAIAGRTRRNTGIASSICRFCEEVQVVNHEYPE